MLSFHNRSAALGITLLMSSLLWMTACTEPQTQGDVATLEAKFVEATQAESAATAEDIQQIVQQLAAAYIAEVDANPKAPNAPAQLYKAAELYQNNTLEDAQKALSLFDRIIKTYPDDPKAADALFNQGFIYHNTLKDIEKAKAVYLTFLEQYPEHDLVASAEWEIKNLGVPAKELLERIQQADSTAAAPAEGL